jgi:glycosyltransferase involved in cell wall biosynthesis
MRITTILPVSRVGYLDRILDSLTKQTYKPDALIAILDLYTDEEYLEARNKIVGLPFKHVVCVPSYNTQPAFAISERREHIASIHNQARQLIADADWVFSIEDDGVLPNDALQRLVRVSEARPNAGIISGVELGRWGVPYVGAWRVDNIMQPSQVMSMENHVGEDYVDEIDACGLYCALIRADKYKEHEFDAKNGLGPDVNLALYLRQSGYQNYIAWAIPVTHLTNNHGIEMEIPATDTSQVVTLTLMGTIWRQTKYPSGQAP